MKKFLLLLAVLIFSANFLYSLSDTTQTSIKIDSVSFDKVSNIEIGDTIQMTVYYQSSIQDTCDLKINFDRSFQFIDSVANTYQLSTQFVADTIGSLNFTFLSIDTSLAQMSLILKMRNIHPGYSDISSYNTFLKYDPRNKMEIQANDDNDDELAVFNYYQTSCQHTPDRHITINGKVLFQDWSESRFQVETFDEIDGAHFPNAKSPYTDVWLFFRKANTVGLTHPILDNPNPIESVHYSKCDDGGNFYFDFDFNIGDIECGTNGYYDIILFITKENESIYLESPSEHIKINNLKNRFRSIQYVNFFNIQKQYLNIDPNLMTINLQEVYFGADPYIYIPTGQNYTWQQIAIPFTDGAGLRHIALSKKFVKAINDQDLPQIKTKILKTNENDEDGYYDPSLNMITIQTAYCNNQALSHEYGHYFDHLKTDFVHGYWESFAMFFSYAFRIWERNVYSDFIVTQDNLEISPFCKQYKMTGNNKSDEKERFGNTTKTFSEGRFACYLWNVYDSKNGGNFSPLYNFANKNNDDVDGLGSDLFAFWIDDDNDNISGTLNFHNSFKSQYNSTLQQSIDAIYDFMQYDENNWPNRVEYDDTPPIALDEHEHWMKSPNLEDFSYHIFCPQWGPCYLIFSWENTNSYDYYGANVRKEWIYHNPDPDFYWHFEYEFYPNIEKSVKIYYKVNDTWQLQQEINPLDYPDEYAIPYPELAGIDYVKASTNNEFAVDSYEPIIWYRYQKRGVVENSDELFSYKVINNKLITSCTPNTSALLISFYDINGKLLYNNIYQIEGKQTFELDLKSILNVTHQFTVLSINVINSDGNVNNYYEKIIW